MNNTRNPRSIKAVCMSVNLLIENMEVAEMENTTLNKLIGDFSKLPLDDKEYVLELIKKQLIEARRKAISSRAEDSANNSKKDISRPKTYNLLCRFNLFLTSFHQSLYLRSINEWRIITIGAR